MTQANRGKPEFVRLLLASMPTEQKKILLNALDANSHTGILSDLFNRGRGDMALFDEVLAQPELDVKSLNETEHVLGEILLAGNTALAERLEREYGLDIAGETQGNGGSLISAAMQQTNEPVFRYLRQRGMTPTVDDYIQMLVQRAGAFRPAPESYAQQMAENRKTFENFFNVVLNEGGLDENFVALQGAIQTRDAANVKKLAASAVDLTPHVFALLAQNDMEGLSLLLKVAKPDLSRAYYINSNRRDFSPLMYAADHDYVGMKDNPTAKPRQDTFHALLKGGAMVSPQELFALAHDLVHKGDQYVVLDVLKGNHIPSALSALHQSVKTATKNGDTKAVTKALRSVSDVDAMNLLLTYAELGDRKSFQTLASRMDAETLAQPAPAGVLLYPLGEAGTLVAYLLHWLKKGCAEDLLKRFKQAGVDPRPYCDLQEAARKAEAQRSFPNPGRGSLAMVNRYFPKP